MVDLVGTCPKGFWEEWIAEGDPAGAAETLLDTLNEEGWRGLNALLLAGAIMGAAAKDVRDDPKAIDLMRGICSGLEAVMADMENHQREKAKT